MACGVAYCSHVPLVPRDCPPDRVADAGHALVESVAAEVRLIEDLFSETEEEQVVHFGVDSIPRSILVHAVAEREASKSDDRPWHWRGLR